MAVQDTIFSEKTERIFTPSSEPLVMGILNITPDSFSDGGKFTSEKEWLKQAQRMVDDGADIIDIGGYSTRPGADEVSEEEEEARLIPAIQSVRKRFPELLISADTFRAGIAEKAVNAGATIINDIGGGTLDEKMFATITRLNVPYILGHIQGTPKTMQENPVYKNVVREIIEFMKIRIEQLNKSGFTKIILDPGIGFGKTFEHNDKIMANLKEFNSLGYPFMVGLSKKKYMNDLLKSFENPNEEIKKSLFMIAHVGAARAGARILRVHDVAALKAIPKDFYSL